MSCRQKYRWIGRWIGRDVNFLHLGERKVCFSNYTKNYNRDWIGNLLEQFHYQNGSFLVLGMGRGISNPLEMLLALRFKHPLNRILHPS
ncbi:hypothetical protein PAHAL_5G358600 [Panicum hallii]|uniref:Uncharacterized protein n=1 Tax=Panicum hallii TaxID=206008 RepID=A0A2T8IMD1_9POAL|nr:hypothetical protein PAHAL_5G358600 [Panicum hallii]